MATMVAFSDWMCPARFRNSMTTGMEPSMSMIANRIIVTDAISFKLNPMGLIYENFYLGRGAGPLRRIFSLPAGSGKFAQLAVPSGIQKVYNQAQGHPDQQALPGVPGETDHEKCADQDTQDGGQWKQRRFKRSFQVGPG